MRMTTAGSRILPTVQSRECRISAGCSATEIESRSHLYLIILSWSKSSLRIGWSSCIDHEPPLLSLRRALALERTWATDLFYIGLLFSLACFFSSSHLVLQTVSAMCTWYSTLSIRSLTIIYRYNFICDLSLKDGWYTQPTAIRYARRAYLMYIDCTSLALD